MSQYQLVPYDRVQGCIRDQLGIPISAGTIANFNQAAYRQLQEIGFETWLKQELIRASVMHADETGINIDGKKHWLHCNSNTHLTYFYAHAKRGCEAMDAMGVLPDFQAYSAMIIGSHTIVTTVPMHCAMPTTCANWSERGNRTNSSGRNRCKGCYAK